MGSAGIRERVGALAGGAASTQPPRGEHPAAHFEPLAAELERRLEPLAAALLSSVREKHPDLDWGVNRAEVSRLTRASLRAQLRSFRQGTLPDRCPDVDSAAVAALARPVGLPVLLDGYRLCQLICWQAWFDLVEDTVAAAAPERRELLARGSDFFFRYADLLSAYVAEAFERQAGQPAAGPERRRFEAINELLEGDSLAASWLELDLDRHHLGVVAWGENALAVARELAAAIGRPLFWVPVFDHRESCWAWLSGTRPLEPSDHRRLLAVDPDGANVALGLEAFGESGFRSSHRQAARAQRFFRLCPGGVLPYSDVVVEALACENMEDARAFVAHELRGIEDDSSRSREIRETLVAYFAAEYNAASAGARLGVHQQTVANRLRAAEERLGQPSIGLRRIELEMALRLRECLPSEVELDA